MLATYNTITAGMELSLPSIVQFHELPAMAAQTTSISPALSFHQQTPVHRAIEALRQMEPDVDNIYYLFVTDSQERLVGVVSLRQLICAAPGVRLFEIMDRRQIALPHDATLEQQAHMMSESGLLALPVTDERGRLVGAMDMSDLIQAMQRESTCEMYHMAGLSRDENVENPGASNTLHRSLWLLGSLVIALLVAWVISSFTHLIASFALLAAFVPLVSWLGVQASRQTLTFTVHSLSMGQINRGNTRKIINHELFTGLINGLLIGGLAGIAGWLWEGHFIVGLVLGVAVLGSLLLAGLTGTAAPLACKALRIEPARSSTMLVTALTSISGVALFLGLNALALSLGYL
jgi:magnesium transporter